METPDAVLGNWSFFSHSPCLHKPLVYTRFMKSKTLTEHLKKLGSKGGQTKGKSKVRGGSEHYRKMAAKRWNKK
jgi:hypothetical protein